MASCCFPARKSSRLHCPPAASLLLLLLLGLCHNVPSASAVVATQSLACIGTQKSDFTMSSSTKLVAIMRSYLAGCQYVIGDIHIMNIREQEFIDQGVPFNMSFLDSIREITGCIYIVSSCFKTPISFKHLQVIRGQNCGKNAITMHYMDTCAMEIPPIDFRSLHYIGKGDVNVGSLRDCYMEKHIDFDELFADKASQKLNLKIPCFDKNRDSKECHADCPSWPDGRRHCWGPEVGQCQKKSKCHSSAGIECPSSRCYVDSRGDEHCCSENCLGGCFGPTSKQCYGCTGFNKNGTCVGTCSRTKVYDYHTARLIEPLEKTYPLGPVCVSQCPGSFFVEDDACVSKCTDGYSANDNKTCVKVLASRHCEATALSAMLCDSKNPLIAPLIAPKVNSSQLCTEFSGDITILDVCFDDKETIDVTKLKVSDLYYIFSRLSVVRGTIYVTLATPVITNLTFLSNLQKIGLNPSKSPNSGNLQVLSNFIQFLGLSSLRYVAGKIDIGTAPDPISSKKKTDVLFCPNQFPKPRAVAEKILFHSEPFPSNFAARFFNKVQNGFFNSMCPFKPDTCSEECDPKYGCWGPSSDHCVKCLHVKAGSHCASNCTAVSGWFNYGHTITLNSELGINENLCSRCSKLCSKCLGPEDNECTDCIHSAFRDDSRCVDKCSAATQYADSNHVCQYCPKACLDPKNGAPTCSGNGSFVGHGGCQLCSMVFPVLRSDGSRILRCLRALQDCPSGFYATVLNPQALQQLAVFPDFLRILGSKPSITASVCLPCADTCLDCSGAAHICTRCRHFEIKPRDTFPTRTELACTAEPRCPNGYFAKEEHRICKPCSESCSSCYGPSNSDCSMCAERKYAYFPSGVGNSSEFMCVDSCPESQPHGVVHQDFGVTCSSDPASFIIEKESTKGARINFIVAGIGLFFILVLISIAFFCYWIRQRSLHAKRSMRKTIVGVWDEDTEPLNGTDTAPNVAILRTISEKELVRGQEIGSGAFGTVFRGDWLPDGDSQKISVAIKILSDSLGDCNVSSELLEESRIMASVDHMHCVRIVGICMTQPLQLITQFMPLGNLRDFLRSRKDSEQIGSSHLLRYAAQIANGMSYLEQRSIIHRDLACRNVLVASTSCIKITDFGLAKLLDNPNEEYNASGGKLPVKWLALECLVSRKFSHKSDVWAYGVTLWEIFMFGDSPYVNVKPNDLADYLEKGERLPQPPICTLDVYILMIKCWMLNESQRPTFEDLEASFKKMATDPGRYVYIKGDKYARNPSNESGSVEHRSDISKAPSVTQLQVSESPLVMSQADAEDCNYSALDTTDMAASAVENEVFRAEPNSPAGQTLSVASTSQQQPQTSGQSGSGVCDQPSWAWPKSSSQKYMNVKKQQQLRLSHNDNKYTSDPCKSQSEEHQPMLPPRSPLSQQLPTTAAVRDATSPSTSAGNGTDDGYLRPIGTRGGSTGGSHHSWGRAPRSPSPSSPTQPPPPPQPLCTSTVQNPEYFFNASRREQYQNVVASEAAHPPTPPPPPPPPVTHYSGGAGAASGEASSSTPPPALVHPLQLWVAHSPASFAGSAATSASANDDDEAPSSSYV